MTVTHSAIYPFAALVGQEEMRLALLLNAVNPAVGGLLIRGEKGTAKSTAVRGLAALLPEVRLCELPVGATEDRVAGGIDFAASLADGKAVFQPGLLAAAHGGMLYVDEVNLLDDHIVDLVLAAAASGSNVVEREGISYRHPAGFILVGTMNPEEGELRPQFLDRFGLCVQVKSCTELQERLELLLRCEAFDRDPAGFTARYEAATRRLHDQILESRQRLPGLALDPALRGFIAELCAGAGVAGHRADLVLEQATLALAALEKMQPSTVHVRRLAPLVLAHRSRERTEPEQRPDRSQQPMREQPPDHRSRSQSRPEPPSPDAGTVARAEKEASEQAQDPSERQEQMGSDGEEQQVSGPAGEQVAGIDAPYRIRPIVTERDRKVRRGTGRRSRTRVAQKQGRSSRSSLRGVAGDIALDATIRAAAPWQRQRPGRLAIRLVPADFRYRVRERRLGNLLVFVVDGSGSMGARGRMTATKGAILSLLLDAYQKRDRVTMVSFRRDRAEVLLPVTSSVELAGRLLADMAVGGRTPLSAGLVRGFAIVRNYLAREPDGRPIVIIITDGRANVALAADRPVEEATRIASVMGRDNRVKYLVIDTEDANVVTFGLARRLATALEADYFRIRDLQARTLVELIRNMQ